MKDTVVLAQTRAVQLQSSGFEGSLLPSNNTTKAYRAPCPPSFVRRLRAAIPEYYAEPAVIRARSRYSVLRTNILTRWLLGFGVLLLGMESSQHPQTEYACSAIITLSKSAVSSPVLLNSAHRRRITSQHDVGRDSSTFAFHTLIVKDRALPSTMFIVLGMSSKG